MAQEQAVSDSWLSPDYLRLIAQFESIAVLNAEEKAALASLPLRVRAIGENRDIVRQGDRPTECCLILEGLVCRYKMVNGGRRQILSLHFPGDLPDLQSLHLTTMDHSLGALTPTRVAFIPHEALRAIARATPSLGELFARCALIDASIFREWIANVGRRTAYERIAHLSCEIYVRMRALGLLAETSFELSMTQTEWGDATGLSTVHVNRTLRDLRRHGLIETHGKVLSIVSWERLKQAADFDPAYLHLRRAEA
jgi:CRP-like cAMP-binding protein